MGAAVPGGCVPTLRPSSLLRNSPSSSALAVKHVASHPHPPTHPPPHSRRELFGSLRDRKHIRLSHPPSSHLRPPGTCLLSLCPLCSLYPYALRYLCPISALSVSCRLVSSSIHICQTHTTAHIKSNHARTHTPYLSSLYLSRCSLFPQTLPP